jgi:hypothetical protein
MQELYHELKGAGYHLWFDKYVSLSKKAQRQALQENAL